MGGSRRRAAFFPRSARLTRPQQFRRVFAAPQRSTDACFSILAASNESCFSRLGVVIGKKHVKQAVARNRVKRVVRESFRHVRHDLAGLDLVVLARFGTAAHGNQRLRDSLARHWQRLSRLSAK